MSRLFPALGLLALSFSVAAAGDESPARAQTVASLIEQLRDNGPDKVCAAAQALRRLGPAAKTASPVLKELLKVRNDQVRLAAGEALWAIHHVAGELGPVYSELLLSANGDVRAAAAWRLGRLAAEYRPAVALLAGALRDENAEVRVQAGQALASLGSNAETALPALLRALGDERLDDAGSPAVPALVEMADLAIPLLRVTFRDGAVIRHHDESAGPHPATVAQRVAHAWPAFGARGLPALLRTLESKNAESRRFALVALSEMARLDRLPGTAIPSLEKCLDDPDKGLRLRAAIALASAQPSSAKAAALLPLAQADRLISRTQLLEHLNRMCPQNPAAREVLLSLLADQDAATVREAYSVLVTLDLPADMALATWTKALSHADPRVRLEAVAGLAKCGSAAKPMLVALRRLFAKEDDDQNRAIILYALTAIDPEGPELVPFLIKSMDDHNSYVRVRAIETLAGLGPKAKKAIPQLQGRLRNPKSEHQNGGLGGSYIRELVNALMRIAPDSAQNPMTLLEALRLPAIRALQDGKNTSFARDTLEDALQKYAPTAAPLLREALKDKDREVRHSVALVLVRAGLEVETALPVLMDNLWDEEDPSQDIDRFRKRVVTVLMRRQSKATPAVAAAWCKAWQAGGRHVRQVLEPGLLVLQAEALPHLLGQLRQADSPKARRDLAHFLARFDGQAKQVLPILRDELREPDFAKQYPALSALLDLGPDGAAAVPELVRLLASPKPEARAAAARSLGRIGPAAQPAAKALLPLLHDPMRQLRILAADALSRVDTSVSEALLTLRDELRPPEDFVFSEHNHVRLPEGLKDSWINLDPIPQAIARFGERGVTVLAEILDNADLDEWSATNMSAQCGAYQRVEAAFMLAELGPEAKSAVPALVRALKDRDPFIREAAASALGRIGSPAKEAAPELITLLERRNRFLSARDPWSAVQRGGRLTDSGNGYGYGQPFDFRSAGPRRLRARFGFGYYESDPFDALRPRYSYDPVYVLGRVDSESRVALPVLNEMARDPGHPGRLAAALAVWRCGGQAPELIPAFTEALTADARNTKHNRSPLRTEIRDCLEELHAQLKPALPAMSAWLEQRWDAADEDRALVVEAIGRLGADAKKLTGMLRAPLNGEPWNARERVAKCQALLQIDGDNEVVLPVLRAVLAAEEERSWRSYIVDFARTVRARAARLLGTLAEKGDDRAGALLVELAKGDENPHVRSAGLESLARLQPGTGAAMTALVASLRHRDAEARTAAASALGRLGPRAKPAQPALKAATADAELTVRQAARKALELLN